MSKHILFDAVTNAQTARYDSEINGLNIPPDAIEVSDEVFWKTINEQDGVWSLVEGEIVKLPFPEPTVDDLIAAKRTSINTTFNTAMQQIIAGIPANEIASWGKQESEARAYMADANAVTPLLDALATARGITKADLSDRIITKADLFATVSGQLIGTRQGLEDQLDVLEEDESTTAEDVTAVVWPS